jgi:hypothetical protein
VLIDVWQFRMAGLMRAVLHMPSFLLGDVFAISDCNEWRCDETAICSLCTICIGTHPAAAAAGSNEKWLSTTLAGKCIPELRSA